MEISKKCKVKFFHRVPRFSEKNKFENISCACIRPFSNFRNRPFQLYFLGNEVLNGKYYFTFFTYFNMYNNFALVAYSYLVNTWPSLSMLDKFPNPISSKTKRHVENFYSTFPTLFYNTICDSPCILIVSVQPSDL